MTGESFHRMTDAELAVLGEQDACKEMALQRSTKRAVFFRSMSVEWATPEATFQALDREFHFDFDPCPLNGNGDGLLPLFAEWSGKRVFCNPPYGPGIGKWLKRGVEADLAVYLIPARTDTRWFHEICLPLASEIRFLRGRLKFGNAITGAPF